MLALLTGTSNYRKNKLTSLPSYFANPMKINRIINYYFALPVFMEISITYTYSFQVVPTNPSSKICFLL